MHLSFGLVQHPASSSCKKRSLISRLPWQPSCISPDLGSQTLSGRPLAPGSLLHLVRSRRRQASGATECRQSLLGRLDYADKDECLVRPMRGLCLPIQPRVFTRRVRGSATVAGNFPRSTHSKESMSENKHESAGGARSCRHRHCRDGSPVSDTS